MHKLIPIQFSIQLGKPHLNRERVLQLLEQSFPQENSLVVLPELFSTGFTSTPESLENFDMTSVMVEDLEFLKQQCRKYRCYILGSTLGISDLYSLEKSLSIHQLVEDLQQDQEVPMYRKLGPLRNLSLFLNPKGELEGLYQKTHPFSFSGEDKLFAAGKELPFFKWGNFTLAPILCYELRFPEIFRYHLNQGVNLFLVQANWPASRQEHWKTLLKARAIENQAFVLGVNCIGVQGKVKYIGGTFLVNPKGEEIAYIEDRESVDSFEIDIDKLLQWRSQFPALSDRKTREFWF